MHTYRFLFSDAMKAEGFTRVSWEIDKVASDFSRLTVTHELEGAPIMGGMVASKFSEQGAGGWAWVLSDMKSVLETGKTDVGLTGSWRQSARHRNPSVEPGCSCDQK